MLSCFHKTEKPFDVVALKTDRRGPFVSVRSSFTYREMHNDRGTSFEPSISQMKRFYTSVWPCRPKCKFLVIFGPKRSQASILFVPLLHYCVLNPFNRIENCKIRIVSILFSLRFWGHENASIWKQINACINSSSMAWLYFCIVQLNFVGPARELL